MRSDYQTVLEINVNTTSVNAINCFKKKLNIADYTNRRVKILDRDTGATTYFKEDLFVAAILQLDDNRLILVVIRNIRGNGMTFMKLLIRAPDGGFHYDDKKYELSEVGRNMKASLDHAGDYIFTAFEDFEFIISAFCPKLNADNTNRQNLTFEKHSLPQVVRFFKVAKISGVDMILATHTDDMFLSYSIIYPKNEMAKIILEPKNVIQLSGRRLLLVPKINTNYLLIEKPRNKQNTKTSLSAYKFVQKANEMNLICHFREMEKKICDMCQDDDHTIFILETDRIPHIGVYKLVENIAAKIEHTKN